MNKAILHLEGLAVLVLSFYLYMQMGYSWLLFLIFLLTPDISMLGYLWNNKVGATIYNLFHTYTAPIVIIICATLLSSDMLFIVSFIWIAHIGMDRMFGYGLKYPSHFKDTHLDNV